MLCKTIICSISIILFGWNAYAVSDCTHETSRLKCLSLVKTYSGDTAKFNIPHLHHLLGNEIKISLSDVKSPGVYSKNKCTKTRGKEAKAFVKDILKNAKSIEVSEVKRSKSFALQGKILVDNKDLSQILLKKKYAVSAKEFKKTDWCKI